MGRRLASRLLGDGEAVVNVPAKLAAKALLAGVRPRDLPGRIRRELTIELVDEVQALDGKLKALTRRLAEAVTATGSGLIGLHGIGYGIGPAGAARILADVGDVARFADRNRFTSWTGTAPLDASSGAQVRHRLSRAGNRRLNHVLSIAAVCQIRHDTAGRAYSRRKLAEGKTPLEALRCLRRATVRCGLPATRRRRRSRNEGGQGQRVGGPGRALGGDSDIQRGRPNPGSRLFGQATSRTRAHEPSPNHPAPSCRQPPTAGSGQLTQRGARCGRCKAQPIRSASETTIPSGPRT